MNLDATGKVSFDHIYTRPDPRAYFSTLREFDYCIPQLAKPYFTKLLKEYREQHQVAVPTILDIGCSYGINAALLKCDATMDELYQRYAGSELDRSALVDRDRDFLLSRSRPEQVRVIGLDSSSAALSYAMAAGFIDDAVHADLEEDEPTGQQREQLADVDLVISTGCLGYVTERTISRVIAANRRSKPWMAHFVLRMFPFTRTARTLAAWNYETVRVGGLFKQRRFASAREQSEVLEALSEVGADPGELEADGWLYAELHVSRPRACEDAGFDANNGLPDRKSPNEIEDESEQHRAMVHEHFRQ